MGGFYGSIQIRTADRDRVRQVAEQIAAARSVRFLPLLRVGEHASSHVVAAGDGPLAELSAFDVKGYLTDGSVRDFASPSALSSRPNWRSRQAERFSLGRRHGRAARAAI